MSYIRTPEILAKLSASHPRNGATIICKICGKPFYVNPHRVKTAKCCSRICDNIYRNTKEFRENMKIKHLGDKSHFWRGGITPQNKIARESSEGKTWSRTIKERDNFTCQNCGKRGGELHSDHIVPFAIAPELRWNLDNGRTLCVKCHKQTPTYAGRILKGRTLPLEHRMNISAALKVKHAKRQFNVSIPA